MASVEESPVAVVSPRRGDGVGAPVTRAAGSGGADRSTGDRRVARRIATRARLFEEAIVEFRTRGVAETEIAVVAERAGVSRSAFYVHFADKDEVLLEFLLIEERRIAEAAAVAVPADATVAELFESVVATVLDAEERLGRRLVRDLCAAQFRPDFASRLTVDDHPLGLMLVEQIARRTSACDPVDPTMIFLTGLFGLLATDDGPDGDRRRRLGVLVAAASSSA